MYVETLIVMAALFDIEQRFHNSLDLRNDFFFLFLTNNSSSTYSSSKYSFLKQGNVVES